MQSTGGFATVKVVKRNVAVYYNGTLFYQKFYRRQNEKKLFGNGGFRLVGWTIIHILGISPSDCNALIGVCMMRGIRLHPHFVAIHQRPAHFWSGQKYKLGAESK